MKTALASSENVILELVMATHPDNTTEEFAHIVKDWLATAKHPTAGKLFTKMVFQPMLVRLPEIDFINDKAGKPVGINQHIGRRPTAAFGNSDGDLQMLQWTCLSDGVHFCLYVHHTDADREWAYDRKSSIGQLDKGLDEAKAKGWTVVDIRNDWKQIFFFEKAK